MLALQKKIKKNRLHAINPVISVAFAAIIFFPQVFVRAGTVSIHDVQGEGESSPLTGQTLTVRGVVVGDFQGADELGGFFLQEESPDGKSTTSEGIFVYHDRTDVRVGDRVELTGDVTEYHGLTEITNVRDLQIQHQGADLPPPTEIRLKLPPDLPLEQFEGMRVVLPQTLTVSDIGSLVAYGSVVLSNGRPMQPTAAAEPGEEARAIAEANTRNRLILDDGSTAVDPVPIPYPTPGMTADTPLRTGYTVTGLSGVIGFSFGAYRFHPTRPAVFDPTANPRTHHPMVTGRLRLAGFNLRNYFNGPTFPTPRGAASPEAFQRQHAKIVAALAGMAADVVGLMEVENDGYGPESAIAGLTAGLNGASAEGVSYDYIRPDGDRLGNDAIANALLYRRETLAPEGPAAALTTGAFAGTSRPPLAQSFRERATGETFTVVVNHFRSRSTPCEDDPEPAGEQGYCNRERTRAAGELIAWLETAPWGGDDPDVLVIGDLNAYAREDPLVALRMAGYIDLMQTRIGPSAYTYLFDGAAGALDHALASPAMASQVHDVAAWHINADEPALLDYTVEKRAADGTGLYAPDPFRSSDHDPVIVGIDPGGLRFRLEDALTALELLAGFPFDRRFPVLDIDKDGRIDLSDAVGLLRAAGTG